MTLLPNRLPSPRRAALVLALLLGPMAALPALAGLVVCLGPDGPTTSWSAGSECPRRGLDGTTTLAVTADAPAASACVTVPGTDEMIAASASVVPASDAAMLPAPATAPGPVLAATPEAFSERGPPRAIDRALRSVVLRI